MFKSWFGQTSTPSTSQPSVPTGPSGFWSFLQGWRQPQAADHAMDAAAWERLEETLIQADLGVDLSVQLVETLQEQLGKTPAETDVLNGLQSALSALLKRYPSGWQPTPGVLNVILVVGVNGSGKTTFLGKLAARFQQQGLKVVIAAGDTFRAAAESQLAVWAKRAGATLVQNPGSEPAAVVFDAVERVQQDQADILLVDTAGRLQNQQNLMAELAKIRAIVEKKAPTGSPVDCWLVVDASIGQNAVHQATLFHQSTPLTGLVVTKLDGSAKGGTLFNVVNAIGKPVHWIGVGEGVEDLHAFDAEAFLAQLVEKTGYTGGAPHAGTTV